MWKRIITEPLVHFALLSLLLFGADHFFGGDNQEDDDYEIIMHDADIDRLVNSHVASWKVPPDSLTLDNLIQKEIRSEVLYREALKMKLDHNDEIVRRRLNQKIEFLIGDLSEQEVDTAILIDYYEREKENYRTEEQYSFYQILVSQKNQASIISKLQNQKFNKKYFGEQGIDNHLPLYNQRTTLSNIRKDYGLEFLDQLTTLSDIDTFHPMDSGFGKHIIYIEKIQNGTIPSFKEIEDNIRSDYQSSTRESSFEKYVKSLEQNYAIKWDLNKYSFN